MVTINDKYNSKVKPNLLTQWPETKREFAKFLGGEKDCLEFLMKNNSWSKLPCIKKTMYKVSLP